MYGKLAPNSKADMAFVQHMIYHLAEEGTMAVVLPHGVLFRGGAEEHIREYLIEQLNCLDAVIGLPANMFYGATIPAIILVFKKCRKEPDNILFIDASQDYIKVKTTNVIQPQHIQKIIDTYKSRTNEDKLSHAVSIKDIRANKYNLNLPRYVDIFMAEDVIDLNTVSAKLIELEEASQKTDLEIATFCSELRIDPPFLIKNPK
jgi:type I restriction enzyme M protein